MEVCSSGLFKSSPAENESIFDLSWWQLVPRPGTAWQVSVCGRHELWQLRLAGCCQSTFNSRAYVKTRPVSPRAVKASRLGLPVPHPLRNRPSRLFVTSSPLTHSLCPSVCSSICLSASINLLLVCCTKTTLGALILSLPPPSPPPPSHPPGPCAYLTIHPSRCWAPQMLDPQSHHHHHQSHCDLWRADGVTAH